MAGAQGAPGRHPRQRPSSEPRRDRTINPVWRYRAVHLGEREGEKNKEMLSALHRSRASLAKEASGRATASAASALLTLALPTAHPGPPGSTGLGLSHLRLHSPQPPQGGHHLACSGPPLTGGLGSSVSAWALLPTELSLPVCCLSPRPIPGSHLPQLLAPSGPEQPQVSLMHIPDPLSPSALRYCKLAPGAPVAQAAG
ncbi:hypothetical protein P7K49_026539 [Saguinus oedipus]|uniref:Uncharacterized protein n=1 Tax=Saguinus oedipus TaxID=9490 RepID=A0ABQ9UEU7_SAGOE|nr:hypothetical protein P7K49_026539 [Saguinus oedipus]